MTNKLSKLIHELEHQYKDLKEEICNEEEWGMAKYSIENGEITYEFVSELEEYRYNEGWFDALEYIIKKLKGLSQ